MKMNQDQKYHAEDKNEDVVLLEEVGRKNKSILRSKTTENQLDLVEKYIDNCTMAENEGLNFLTRLNHPVIPSMRDLNRNDINYIVNVIKKGRTHERSISFILLIDYLAISIANPLYSDHIAMRYDHFKTLYPEMIRKILMELKSIIMNWSFSDMSEIKERTQAIVRYLQLLLPIFESSADGLDKIIKNIINTFGKTTSTKAVNDEDDKTTLIKIPVNLADGHSLNNSTIKISVSSIKSSSSTSPMKKPRLDDENDKIEVCYISLKQNPVPSTVSSSTNSDTKEKKTVNAFALMMEQSRLKVSARKEKKKATQSKLDNSKK